MIHGDSWNTEERAITERAFLLFTISCLAGSTYWAYLSCLHHFKATDPRDMLFAILGLSQDTDRFNPALQPDYSMDVVVVYVHKFLEESCLP